MKRDMELVRKLLLHIEEEHVYDTIASSDITIEGYSESQIGYHLHIMAAGGLIDAKEAPAFGDDMYYLEVEGITWYGHEFLDSVRDEGVWSGVKSALKPIGSASFEVIKNLAVALIAKQLGL